MAYSDTVHYTDIIYRIEHRETNTGPFQTPDVFFQKMAAFLSMPSNRRAYPSPYDDGIVLSAVPFSWVFGCDSLDQLMNWVSLGCSCEENLQIYQYLEDFGFVIRAFLIDQQSCKYSRSGVQVCFDADTPRQEGMFEEMQFSDYVKKHGVRIQFFGPLQFSRFKSEQLDYA